MRPFYIIVIIAAILISIGIVYTLRSVGSKYTGGSIVGGSYSGIVKPIEASIYQQGSHFLVDDNGKLLLLLESSTVNLSDYNGKKVTVSGPTKATVEGSQKIMNVQSIKLVSE